MHYFQVVLCTLLVPSKISRGISMEIPWKSIGSPTSGPLAEPIEKHGKSRKIKGKSMVPGLAGLSKKIQNLPGHWKSSKNQ